MLEVVNELTAKALAWFDREKASVDRRSITYAIDMRFRGQNFELVVEIGHAGSDGIPQIVSLETILERFFEAHERAYGYADKHAPVEVVNFSAVAKAALGVERPAPSDRRSDTLPAPVAYREVIYSGTGGIQTPIFHRDDLQPGNVFQGPAIIDQMDSTTIVFPGDTISIDGTGNMIITLDQSND